MKRLKDFIMESESSQNIYVVYFGDGTMQNFYYTEEEAKKEVEALNKENADAKASFKKEPRKNIEK